MHYFLFCLLLITCIGCNCMNVPPESFRTWPGCKATGPMYRNRVLREINTEDFSEVIIPYSVELRYEKRLHLQQSYVLYAGADPKIRLQFISQDILELCQARALLVGVVEEFLARLNDKFTKSEIFHLPFTAADLEIYIDFESYYCKYMDPYYIGWIALEDSMAFYYAFSVKNYSRDFWQVRIEPYFKSLSFATIKQRAEIDYEKAHPIIKNVNLNKEEPQDILNPIKGQYQLRNTNYFNDQSMNDYYDDQDYNDYFDDGAGDDYSDDQDGNDDFNDSDDYSDDGYAYPDSGVLIQDGGYRLYRGGNLQDRKAHHPHKGSNLPNKRATPRVNPVNPLKKEVNPPIKGVDLINKGTNPPNKRATPAMPQQPQLPKQNLPQQHLLRTIERVPHPGEPGFRQFS